MGGQSGTSFFLGQQLKMGKPGQFGVEIGQVKNAPQGPREWPKTNRTRCWEMMQCPAGTPANGYYACLSDVFSCFFVNFWPIMYIVLHCWCCCCSCRCCSGRYFLVFTVYFCAFNFALLVSFHYIQPWCAPGYVRPHIHTHKQCTYHYDCVTISVDSIQ